MSSEANRCKLCGSPDARMYAIERCGGSSSVPVTIDYYCTLCFERVKFAIDHIGELRCTNCRQWDADSTEDYGYCDWHSELKHWTQFCTDFEREES